MKQAILGAGVAPAADLRRRRLVQAIAGASLTLHGCGGGAGSGTTDSGAPPPAPPVAAPPPPPQAPPAAVPPGAVVTTVVLTSARIGSVPFAFGQVFSQGDIPAGSQLSGLQLQEVSHWPDGSVRFAVVAGLADRVSGGSWSVELRTGTPVAGRVLTPADLQATGITAQINADARGSVVWSGADWQAPERTWVSGQAMSSWLFRKPLAARTQLTAWLEVRLWANGEIEVLPWIENGYIMRADATNHATVFRFALSGVERFARSMDLQNRCRTVLLEGNRMAWWLGDDPAVQVRHDVAYMMASRTVPHMPTNLLDSAMASWPTAFVPLEQGLFPASIGTGGYHPSIGVLPSWDAAYLTSGGSPQAWRQLQWQGYRAGRYGTHFRDENTERPARLSHWPTAVFGRGAGISDVGATASGIYATSGTGTVPPRWAVSHHPSVGFMAAVLTGRCYHVETCQFAAAICALHQSPQYRGEGSGALRSNSFMQVRGFGWALRTLGQAVVVSPSSDPLSAEFKSHIAATARLNHERYVAQPNNPQGLMQSNGPGLGDYTATDPYVSAPWMLDFVTASTGYLMHCTASIGTGQDELRAWFHWMAQSVVGRFGGAGPGEYLYRDAANLTMAFAPTDRADWTNGTGPWYANWGEIWAATVNSTSNPKELGDGSLRNGGVGNPGSYWHNLMPALAYAVDHGAAGASDAWRRFAGAPNFNSGVANFLRTAPEWGVFPRAI
jgi:hypothetical protein